MGLEELPDLVKVFEDIQKIRVSIRVKLTHLAKQVLCEECLKNWVPVKPERVCPKCKGKITPNTRECPQCGTKIERLKNCPYCGSSKYREDPKDEPYLREHILPRVLDLENELKSKIRKITESHPVYDSWAKKVKGAGPHLVGLIIAHTDIKRCHTISKFWAHCGFALKNGEIQRRRKGKKIDYDVKLQSICILTGESLIKQRGKFFEWYKERKRKYLVEECRSPGHAHNRAFREMIKLFLSLLYEVWRKEEGLGFREPYPHEYLGHTYKINPEEMVDKEENQGKEKRRARVKKETAKKGEPECMRKQMEVGESGANRKQF